MHLPLISDLLGQIPHNGIPVDGSSLLFVHPPSHMASPTYCSPTFDQVAYRLQKIGLQCDLQSVMFHSPNSPPHGRGLSSPFSLSYPSCLEDYATVTDKLARRPASFDMSPTSSTSSDLENSTPFGGGHSSVAAFIATRSRVVRVGVSLIYLRRRQLTPL